MNTYRSNNELIIDEIKTACSLIDESQVENLVLAITKARKVFLIGVGRVFLALESFAKRLNHLGISAHCVGDVNEPAITEADLLIVGSGSGESLVPLAITGKAKQYHAMIAHIGSNPNSAMKDLTDLFVRIPVKTKLNLADEIQSEQMMSSLFEQSLYILCDTISMMIVQGMNKDMQGLWAYHANLE